MNAIRTRFSVVALVVLTFVALFVGGFVFFWGNAGGWLPGKDDPYRVLFETSDVKNLLDRGDVSMAGVKIGQAKTVELAGDRARVVLSFNREAAPLHEGATVRIGVKSLMGTSYVDVVDGGGKPIPEGSELPDSAVKSAVDIDEIISTFDPNTRKELTAAVRSLGSATDGTAPHISRLMEGLGRLGREGHTALEAIAAQSDDLRALSQQATVLLDTLNTGRGQIGGVVRDANALMRATARQRPAVEATLRGTPALLKAARDATGKLEELSGPLAPVAADLNQAAPHLNRALLELPPVTRDLRGLLPDLDKTLDKAPGTLQRIPPFASDMRTLIPHAETMLQDVNPMLAYMRPYGKDLGAFFANWGASLDMQLPNGIRPLPLAMIYNSASVGGNPLSLQFDPLHWNNPYPKAGQAGNPAPWEGKYPRVERGPK